MFGELYRPLRGFATGGVAVVGFELGSFVCLGVVWVESGVVLVRRSANGLVDVSSSSESKSSANGFVEECIGVAKPLSSDSDTEQEEGMLFTSNVASAIFTRSRYLGFGEVSRGCERPKGGKKVIWNTA